MAKLNPMEDKDFEARKSWLDLGAHEIKIVEYKTGKANSGSEFIEFVVEDADGAQAKTTLWLTEKAAERTRSILAAVAVHNKEGEVEKQKVRDAFKKIDDSDQMKEAKFLDKFVGLEAWALVEEDLNAPKENGGYYTRANLYSYPPKPRKTAEQEAADAGVTGDQSNIDLSEIPFE